MPFLRAGHKAYFGKRYVRRNLSLLFKLPFIRGSKRFLEKFIEPLEEFGVKYDGLGPEMVLSEQSLQTGLARFPIEKNNKWIGLIS